MKHLALLFVKNSKHRRSTVNPVIAPNAHLINSKLENDDGSPARIPQKWIPVLRPEYAQVID
jgi:hypothetical protein